MEHAYGILNTIIVLFLICWTFYLTHKRIDHLRDDLYKHIDYVRNDAHKKTDRN